jgi:hypothetical protein
MIVQLREAVLMLTQALWWSSNALLVVLVILGLRNGLFGRYLLFYTYVVLVLTVSLVRFYVYTFVPDAYLGLYWYSQFLSVAAGYGVTWEIYSQTFRDYPGASRMATFVVGSAFAMVIGASAIAVLRSEENGWIRSVIGLERNVRSVQAVLLILLILLIVYYKIPLGRNLRGLLWGYSLFISLVTIALALRAYFGPSLGPWWAYSQQMSYLVALLVWTISMWSYEPRPIPKRQIALDRDYAFLAERTVQSFARARVYMKRALFP